VKTQYVTTPGFLWDAAESAPLSSPVRGSDILHMPPR
jgi:hypothetical protein